jgi:hypothetical protein
VGIALLHSSISGCAPDIHLYRNSTTCHGAIKYVQSINIYWEKIDFDKHVIIYDYLFCDHSALKHFLVDGIKYACPNSQRPVNQKPHSVQSTSTRYRYVRLLYKSCTSLNIINANAEPFLKYRSIAAR